MLYDQGKYYEISNKQAADSSKILFIDRDGTLILEPEDEQIDSFEKLTFYPGMLTWLGKIVRELNYKLVMVTNQDGLGTAVYPEETFWPIQNFMIKTLENEGIFFSEIFIDKTLPKDQSPTRKPGLGMLQQFIGLKADDLSGSYVIGDRLNDTILAKNLGCKAIFINANNSLGLAEFTNTVLDDGHISLLINKEESVLAWEKIYNFLKVGKREFNHKRNTNETKISIKLNLDGTGKSVINTGLPFFDHMLDQLARHGQMDLSITTKGDLHIDEHHTIEDTALALGEVFLLALGDKKGIERYGFCLPMDDCLAQVALDFGGRNWLVWDADFKREKVGDMPTEMFYHFFKSFSDAAKCNLNIKAEGVNEHHKIEAIFKAFAKAIKMAVKRDLNKMVLPSTKGVL